MNSQFKKGALELCVLSLMNKKDVYGYELVNKISEKIEVTSGTIYPLLSRLKKQKYFENYLKESEEGPPRKYYKITENGKKHLEELKKEWEEFVENVKNIIEGDINDE